MIAYIKGKLAQHSPTQVVVETNGGVAYMLNISLHTYDQLLKADPQQCLLHTHLHIKEDAHTLYGFAEVTERELFVQLISVSGIGPARHK